MSRRYLVPSNLFYRDSDPLPPAFPEPHEGDIYFNTISRTLRIWQDDGSGFAWRDLQVRIDTGDPDNPVPPIYDLTSADGTIVISNPGTGIVDITVDPDGHSHGFISNGVWTYDTNETMAAPTSGRLRSNAATASSVTQIALSELTNEGADASAVLARLTTDDEIVFQERANADNWARFSLTAPPTDNTTWWLLDVAFKESRGSPVPKNADITVTVGVGGGGTKDHGALEGLADDDHPQYLNLTRGDARYDLVGTAASAVAGHEAQSDPHPQYVTGAEGDAAYVKLTGSVMTGALTTTELLIDYPGVTNEAHFVAGEGDPNVTRPVINGMGVYVDVSGASGIWITDIPGDTTTWSQVGTAAHHHDGSYVKLADHGSSDHSGLLATVAPIGHVTSGEDPAGGGDLLHVQYPTLQPSDLDLNSAIGVSDTLARADHVHKRPTLGELSAAASSHTHDGADIDTGTVAFVRLPTGTTSTTVAIGNHTHAYVPTTRNLTAGSGLTGGGALSADRAFNVGAGTGITVNADSIEVNKGTLDGWYDANGQATSIMSTHEGLADPHSQYQRESEKGIANGYAPLDGSGVIPESYIPAVPPNELFSVANSTERTTYATYTGNGWTLNYRDEVIQEDDGTLWVYIGPDPATSDADLVAGNWTQKSAGGVVSVNGETGAVTGFVKDSRTVIAGSGLTGGGDLTANVTVNVGQGTGISVTSTSVAIDKPVVDTWYEAAGSVASAITNHHDAGSGDHDDRYYTESEVDAFLTTKEDAGHLHEDDYVNVTGDTMTGELRITGDFSASGVVRSDDPANYATKPGYIWIREDDDTGASDPVFDPANYASVGHAHPGVYSPVGHTHAGDSASVDHTHSGYADSTHSHTEYFPSTGGAITGDVDISGMLSVSDMPRTDDPSPLSPGMLWIREDEAGTDLGDPANHFHDDRYYTETETDDAIATAIASVGGNSYQVNTGSVSSFSATTDFQDIPTLAWTRSYTKDTSILVFFSCAWDVNLANSLIQVNVSPATSVWSLPVRSDPVGEDGPLQVTCVTFARVPANTTINITAQARVFNGSITMAFWSPGILIVPMSLE